MSVRLAVLVSGPGNMLMNLIERIQAGRLDASIAVVVSSSPDALALLRARENDIPAFAACTPASSLQPPVSTALQLGRQVFDYCRQYQAELVIMAGFLKLLHIPEDFAGRVMNIHPALIPAFCGKGFYGSRVHEAVLKRGVKVTGCTVHFADNVYDHGPIILQRVVSVQEGDTPDRLFKRVFAAECEAYPEAIRLFAEGKLIIEGQRVRIKDEG